MKTKTSLPKMIEKAQRVFNKYIRLRDAGKPCVSCYAPKIEQASHFYSAGQHTALRFNPDNVHGSCLQCNYFKHGNLIPYRRELINRIGEEKLSLLESTATRNRVYKWSAYELQIIIDEYQAKIKEHGNY